MQNAIETKNLTKRFPGFCLEDINITLPSGCVMGLIGENGAGKTTTIKLLLNILSRDGGEVRLFGQDSDAADEIVCKQEIGVVLDDSFFHETLRPVDVGRILGGIYRNWDQKLFRSYLGEFHLPEKKTVKELSRGMRQKLNIAAALSHRPKLLVMDEATSGLDPVVRDEILDLLRGFIQDEACSVLLSSHITSDLDKIADYVTFLHKGRLVFSEPRDELMGRYALLRLGRADAERIPPAGISGRRDHKFGVDLLVSDKAAARRAFPEAELEPVDLEDIMLFYIKKGE